MTFDQWQHRPVYVVQCFAWGVYRNQVGNRFRLMVLPAYRTATDQDDRDQTARILRQMRRDGLHREDVMKQHEQRLADPNSGVVERVDIDRELARMARAVR